MAASSGNRPASTTLITVAPTGAETAKADVPQLPTTLEELVETARACEAAGAGLIHVHVRDAEHRPTLDAGRLKDTVQALREQTSLVVQLSTGGSVHDPLEQRLTVLDAEPDSCSLTCGTTNFGDDVFLNPYPFMSELYQLAQERMVVPEFELFDLGHVAALRRLIDTHGLPYGGRVHVDFVTGVPGGMPGTVAALLAGIQALPPEVTSWSATGIGRTHLPIAAAALAAGGHLRVGMEDNLVYAKGRPVQHNAELVSRAAELATLMQRPPMSTDEARALLAVKDRRPDSGT
jgi:3-keto-5-aminohexanoate cleavage enzyme